MHPGKAVSASIARLAYSTKWSTGASAFVAGVGTTITAAAPAIDPSRGLIATGAATVATAVVAKVWGSYYDNSYGR